MYFKCPVCDNYIHFKDKDDRFPVNYKLKCKFCTSIFGFIPKVFVRADFTLNGEELKENEIKDILELDEGDDDGTVSTEELASVIDEFEKNQKN